MQLSSLDTQFEPWELGRSDTYIPAMYRARATSRNEPQGPTNEQGLTNEQALKRTRQNSAELVPSLKKRRADGMDDSVTIGTLKENHPEFYTLVIWAKGQYRSLCMLKEPYLAQEQKLLLAEESYKWSETDHPIGPYPKELTLNQLVMLVSLLQLLLSAYLIIPLQISNEHSVFRSNSVDRAGEVIHAHFPPDIVISATQVVGMLEAIYDQRSATADNFFASRKPATSTSVASGSGSLSHLGFALEMVHTFIFEPSLNKPTNSLNGGY